MASSKDFEKIWECNQEVLKTWNYAPADKQFKPCPGLQKQPGSRGLCDFLVKSLA